MTSDGTKRPRTSSDPGFGEKASRPLRRPFLFLAFHASRPLDGGARFCLTGTDEVHIGYGEHRGVERRRVAGKLHLTITVNCRAMSQAHARLRRTSEGWVVEDSGSRNGVFLNGTRINRGTILRSRDAMTLGRAFFFLEYHDTDDGSDVDARDVNVAPPGLLTLLPSHSADLANLASIARTATPITLVGETGTGKELVAKAIHKLSGRTGPYVAINCAAIARTLIESELFGYVKGAFSGAAKNQPGHIQAADRGTLLLDEILATPPELQAALLRVLQEGEVVPVGARGSVRLDVRFIAAAQTALAYAVDNQGFRPDLKARLEGFILELPCLRNRIQDIGIFVAHALRSHGATEADSLTFTLPAALRLLRYNWPGNIRELAVAVGRARTLIPAGRIDEEHLLLPDTVGMDDRKAEPEALERELIANLRLARGDVAEVARRMGRNRTLVYKWMQRFKIHPSTFRAPDGASRSD